MVMMRVIVIVIKCPVMVRIQRNIKQKMGVLLYQCILQYFNGTKFVLTLVQCYDISGNFGSIMSMCIMLISVTQTVTIGDIRRCTRELIFGVGEPQKGVIGWIKKQKGILYRKAEPYHEPQLSMLYQKSSQTLKSGAIGLHF